MPKVIVDGVKYVPKAEIPELTDSRMIECLKALTSMRYFGEMHKMMPHSLEAISALSPELAKLSRDDAYERIHGHED